MIVAIIETSISEKDKFKCWFQNKYLWYAFLILLGAVISLINANFFQNALIEIFQLMFVITVFISLIWIMVLRNKTKVIVKAFVFSGLFTASVTLTDFLLGSRLGPMLSNTPNIQLWGRYAGTLGHPNKFGFFLVITSILTLYLVFSSHKWKRFLWIFCLIIQLIGIYLSGSLTAYLGIFLGAFLILLHEVKSIKISLFRLSILLFMLSAFFIAVIAYSNMYSRKPINLANITLMVTVDRVLSQTAGSRIVLFQEAFQSILKSPVVGVGFDQISTSGISRQSRELSGTVHNVSLQILYVGGIFSFLGLLLIYINLAINSLKILFPKIREDKSNLIIFLATATLSIVLMDQFQDSLYQREKWLLFGLFISVIWIRSTSPQRIANQKNGIEIGTLEK
jgi:O-antigen ligase